MINCYCGNNRSYTDCCGVFHNSQKTPSTAEQLMRSRYTAFVLSLGDYLIETHATSTQHTINKNEIELWAKSVKWIGLEIRDVVNGKEGDQSGKVEFIARFKENIFKRKIHEQSLFIRENGEWKYLNGRHF